MSVPGRVKALWLLGWSLVFTLLRRWFTRQRGLARFHENYARENLLPLSVEDRQALASFSGCIACGLCDQGERERIQRAKGQYHGLMTLALCSLRSTTDVGAAERSWAHVPDEILDEKERLCPTGVPFRRMKQFVSQKARELAESGGGTNTLS